MPALSGSAVGYKQARAGIERAGCSRANHYTPNLVITINGVDRSTNVIVRESLRIRLARNDEPDSATFTLHPKANLVPTAGHEIIIGMGTLANRLFAGQIMEVTHRHRPGATKPWVEVSCADWSALFNRRKITGSLGGQSASVIATTIVSTYTSGFTTATHVVAGLDTVDEFICAHEPPLEALRRLALMVGGGCYIDANKSVHFWGAAGETTVYAPTDPTTLTSKPEDFTYVNDYTQIRTRILVATNGGQTTTDVVATQAAIPLDDVSNMIAASAQALIANYGAATVSLVSPLGAATSTTAAVSAGATSIPVTSIFVIAGAAVGLPGWIKSFDSDQVIYFAGASGSDLTGVPTSGPGSIRQDIPINTLVYHLPQIALGSALTADVPAGTSVMPLTTVDDTAAQTAIAAIEGGDGIHEHLITEDSLAQVSATAIGEDELDRFSSALSQATWSTYDMNAIPGTAQVFNTSAPDAVSATVTIDTVALTFPNIPRVSTTIPISNGLPHRQCAGGTLKLESVLELIRARKN